MKKIVLLTLIIVFFYNINTSFSQRKKSKDTPATNEKEAYSPKVWDGMEWRSIGPFRGGRSAAVTGVPGKPNLFYFGATGGGVWKTNDGGNSWENISDGFFGGSVGAVAVSEWDNNVIYAGGGEVTVRGNVSYGYGMYKSDDAGKSWEHIGLENSRHIPRIVIHPKNPDIVYAAVLGDLYKSANDRGVYKSIDGGKTWQKKLFANANAGAVDLVMDPNNPRIMFASTWKIRRTPYSLESGGEGSALWKSTDGGETWKNISSNKGLPSGVWGISGVSVSRANSNRVFAIIENMDGGVFRSDDGGETWEKTNSDRSLRQRAWYYTRIYADSKDVDKVYVLNVSYHVSNDGGKTFKSGNAPHGDHHDLWIAPEDNQRLIMADDGGAQVSYDGGVNWSTYYNQPTAQFYRVTTDNHFPYRIYGAQQDNSTIRILHRTDGASIGERDWEPTAGGESAHLAVHPGNSNIVYGGSYDGFLTRINHQTNEVRGINVWPDNPMGHGAEGFKFRFQWNFPIFFSPHDPKKLYTASNHLHVTYNEGQSWELMSPDLTTNDPKKLGSSGGPITKDNTSVEYYCTIFAAIESPYEKDLLWTGSDDGLIHMSDDGGKTWNNVTPPNMPDFMMINSIDANPFVKGGVYVAGTRYKLGDYQPYLYKTTNYGKTWQQITGGIPKDHFTRVVRADPQRKGLLYAGTESGMYLSFNDGANWQPFQLNLPIVPITDLTIKNDNLIAATQGRSFWLIDDLTPLHQITPDTEKAPSHLFKPMPSYRMEGRSGTPSRTAGTNHPGGVMIHFYLKDTTASDTVTIDFLENNGKLIQRYTSKPDKKEKPLAIKPGFNRFVWNMRYPEAEDFKDMVLWWASLNGPKALPGTYKVRLTYHGQTSEQEFEILQDPRSSSSLEDLKANFDFMIEVRDKLTETHQAITNIRETRKQINAVNERVKDSDGTEKISASGKEILSEIKEIEETLYQTKNRSSQDPLNYPIRLNNKLGHLNSLTDMGDFRPTDQAIAFKNEIIEAIDSALNKLYLIFESKIPEFNALVQEAKVDAVQLK
ncbi:MAG: glycosyl hydrolase [Cyclobacteriaceae bacterium]|nr:glycosyl hydrolase [Cyclobacteriaceae bacterium]